jgi:hypothetical protein
MDWSLASTALADTKTPSGYQLVPMSRSDVAEVTRKLGEWYPDIVVGAESCHLDPEFYHAQVMLDETQIDRPIFSAVAKHDQAIVAMITFEKNSRALTITSRMGAVAPEHRGPGLGLLGPVLLEKIGRAIGAELAYYFATLKTPHQQVLAERSRYRLVGIVPAFDRDMIRPGEVKRVYEAIYAKVLVEPEGVLTPPAEALTIRTRALFNALFDPATGLPPQATGE